MRKIIFPASIVASAATAFGLGALAFNSPSPPATSLPAPTVTQTMPADSAQPVPAEVAQPVAATSAKTANASARPAGAAGPFEDAQRDGKVLDDAAKSMLPKGVSVHVPDALLPFPGRGSATPVDLPPGVVPAQPDGTYTDPDAGTDTSDDVVSGAPGESTTDTPPDNGVPLDAARPGPKPGGAVSAPVLPPGVVPALPPGVVPALPPGVLPAGVVVAN